MTKVCGSTMGHTYHWRTNLDIHEMLGHYRIDLAWDSYKKDVETLFELTKSESEKYIKDLEISDDVISFNGSCEGFRLEKNPKWKPEYKHPNNTIKWSYTSCKTDREPYDKWVTACLILAMLNLGQFMRITSDGNDLRDWVDGFRLAEKVMEKRDLFHFGSHLHQHNEVSLSKNEDNGIFVVYSEWVTKRVFKDWKSQQ